MKKKKNLIIFGTRPEAIKMAPLVKEFLKNQNFKTKVCVTGQHREMLDQVLTFFDTKPDYDLDLMRSGQNLYSLTANIIEGLKPILDEFKPDFVYVHGDTTTTMGASIASFYAGAKVCHIEAGLRTFDKTSPFPEEINRKIIGQIADFHFAPTQNSYNNLIREGILSSNIIITGNTVIDALLYSIKIVESQKNKEIENLKNQIDLTKRVILVTAHRRENHGQDFINICNALKEIGESMENVQIVFPVHLNPEVQKPVYEILKSVRNVTLISPLSYPAFVWLMNMAELIITDSGGIQEEAPSLGKPVILMRNITDRQEVVLAGTVILVGTNKEKIVNETLNLLNDDKLYKKMSEIYNPYGDGKASKRIVEFIEEIVCKTDSIGIFCDNT